MNFLFVATCNLFRTLSFQIRGFISPWIFAVNFLGQTVKDTTEETDEDLVKKLQDGDDHAFEILYDRYFDPIFRYTMRRVGHYQTAEDLVSHVFMKAFGARKKLKINSTFKAWIYTITCNAIIDYYRTNKKEGHVDEHEELQVVAGDAPRIVDVKITRDVLEKALRKLDARSRQILTMKFFGQMSHTEIAVAIGVSANHVGVLVFRALKECQKYIPDHFLR